MNFAKMRTKLFLRANQVSKLSGVPLTIVLDLEKDYRKCMRLEPYRYYAGLLEEFYMRETG